MGELAHRIGVTPVTLRAWERAGILRPARRPPHGHRSYGPDDVRDAELAHLLRRGGYPLGEIATVVTRLRDAGGAEPLAASLAAWRDRLTARARAMLVAAARLADHLDLVEGHGTGSPGRGGAGWVHDDKPAGQGEERH